MKVKIEERQKYKEDGGGTLTRPPNLIRFPLIKDFSAISLPPPPLVFISIHLFLSYITYCTQLHTYILRRYKYPSFSRPTKQKKLKQRIHNASHVKKINTNKKTGRLSENKRANPKEQQKKNGGGVVIKVATSKPS